MNKFTYGKTPAAIYLVDVLNAKNNEQLNRKVGKTITRIRELIINLSECNSLGPLRLKNFSILIPLIREEITRTTTEELRPSGGKLVSDLTTNILLGELNKIGNRVSKARANQSTIHRNTPPGIRTQDSPVVKLPNEKTPEMLMEKSKKKYKNQ